MRGFVLLAVGAALGAGCGLAFPLDSLTSGSGDDAGDSGAAASDGTVPSDGPSIEASDDGSDEHPVAPHPIVWHGTESAFMQSQPSVAVALPSAAGPGDLLVAAIGFGDSGLMASPSITAPTGWTLVDRVDHSTTAALAVFTHPLAAGESTYTWTFGAAVSGTAWVSAYAGVDASAPVDAQMGQDDPQQGTAYATPALPSLPGGDCVVASVITYSGNGTANTWTAPALLTIRADVYNGQARSGVGADVVLPQSGTAGPYTLTASSAQSYGLSHLLALRPM